MKISAIKKQVKNPDRVSVYIDNVYSFSLTIDELLSAKLKSGTEIDSSRLKELKKISEDGKLRYRALEWALSRPRSAREFRQYLFRKRADPELIGRLVDEFQSRGYLDEVKFVSWLTDVRRRANKSDKAIRAELASKGVARDLITAADDDSELARLKSLVAKKRNLSRYRIDQSKLVAYLSRQGFPYDSIRKVLNEDD